MREREMERELEEEERRERERTARLKAAQTQQSAPRLQVEVKALSRLNHPLRHTRRVGWGGPPPLPIHTMQTNDVASLLSPYRHIVNKLYVFAFNNPDFDSFHEPQLDLADLINIDDEAPSHDAPFPKK
jgi:hypothetical protein